MEIQLGGQRFFKRIPHYQSEMPFFQMMVKITLSKTLR
jgi:hypothetical protein